MTRQALIALRLDEMFELHRLLRAYRGHEARQAAIQAELVACVERTAAELVAFTERPIRH